MDTRPSQRPTRPAPPCAIAPRPDDAMVCSLLDNLAHQTQQLVRVYGGSRAAVLRALEIAHSLRSLAHDLGLPGASDVATDLLQPEPPEPPAPLAPLGDRRMLRLDEELTLGGTDDALRDLAASLGTDAGIRLLREQLTEGLQEHEGDSEGAADQGQVRHGW